MRASFLRMSWVALQLIIVLAIPGVSLKLSLMVHSNAENEFVETANGIGLNLLGNSVGMICSSSSRSSLPSELRSICKDKERSWAVVLIALVVGSIGLSLLLFIWIAPLLSKDRSRLFWLFAPGLLLTKLLLALLVLANGVLVTVSLFLLAPAFALAGLFVIGTSVRILFSLLSFKRIEVSVFGTSIGRENSPMIWRQIDTIAKAIGTSPPQNLIVGVSPTFFVTESRVRSVDRVNTGKTLYLSIPFCRLLSVPELESIMAHELAHFAGSDTVYSRKFYPVYRGAKETLRIFERYFESLNEETSSRYQMMAAIGSVAVIPAWLLMRQFFKAFETLEKGFSRQRELAADETAGKTCGAKNIVTALIKVHAYSAAWPSVESNMLKLLKEGKRLRNVAELFEFAAKQMDVSSVTKTIGFSHTEHPTDSHPSLETRLEALGFKFDPEIINDVLRNHTLNPATSVIDRNIALEQELTILENAKLMHANDISQRKAG